MYAVRVRVAAFVKFGFLFLVGLYSSEFGLFFFLVSLFVYTAIRQQTIYLCSNYVIQKIKKPKYDKNKRKNELNSFARYANYIQFIYIYRLINGWKARLVYL